MSTQTAAPPAATTVFDDLTAPAPQAPSREPYRRLGGWLLLLGSIAMLAGAVLLTTTGTDLDTALVDGEVGAWLNDVEAHRTVLLANLVAWTFGVPTLALGGVLLTRMTPTSPASMISRFGFTAGAAAAIVYYPLWMGLILGLGGRPDLEPIATALGQGVTLADWANTTLVLSVGGAALAFSGRNSWVPTWLVRFAYAAAAMGPIAMLGVILDAREPSFLLIPVGMFLVISLSIAALRTTTEQEPGTR